YSLLASRLVGPRGRVCAIEAIPHIFDALNKNIDTNHAKNIASFNVAVSKDSQPITMFFDPNHPGTSTANLHSHGEKIVVPGKPLTSIVDSAIIRNAKIIKIDVEGAEWAVLQGLGNELRYLSPNTEIIIEANVAAICASGSSLGEFLKLFSDAGFKPYRILNPYSPAFYAMPLP